MDVEGIGPYIRRKREGAGLSQGELARRIGIPRAYLSQIESGRVALPGADLRRRAAAALGVSHQALLVAAGELTAEEVGEAAMRYRPPFPEGDERRLIAELLPDLRDDDAKTVRIVARDLIDRRRSIGVEEVVPAAEQSAQEGTVGLGKGQARLFAVDQAAEDECAPVVL